MTSYEYLIVFEDLIGSTAIGDSISHDDFAGKYMSSFHWAANRAIIFFTLLIIFDILI